MDNWCWYWWKQNSHEVCSIFAALFTPTHARTPPGVNSGVKWPLCSKRIKLNFVFLSEFPVWICASLCSHLCKMWTLCKRLFTPSPVNSNACWKTPPLVFLHWLMSPVQTQGTQPTHNARSLGVKRPKRSRLLNKCSVLNSNPQTEIYESVISDRNPTSPLGVLSIRPRGAKQQNGRTESCWRCLGYKRGLVADKRSCWFSKIRSTFCGQQRIH